MEYPKVGGEDRSSIFKISSKVYGREEEIKEIIKTIDYVKDGGRRMLIFVEGSAGIYILPHTSFRSK